MLSVLPINVSYSDEDITCHPSPNSLKDPIILHRNSLITINCSFQYEADNSCVATPLWSDFETKENVLTFGNNHNSGFNNNYLWLTLKGNLGNVNSLWLRIAFKCGKDHHHPWNESLIFDTGILYNIISNNSILSFTCLLRYFYHNSLIFYFTKYCKTLEIIYIYK